MQEHLVVDGYNVINDWPELKELARVSLEHARLKLLDILANYRGLVGLQVIVVFDAHSVKGLHDRSDTYLGMEVIFSREGETADSVIERFVHVNQGKKIFVVTSDWEEQRFVFGSGAYRLSSRQLREEVLKTEKEVEMGKSGRAVRALENRLPENVRQTMEAWRRQK